LAGRLAAGEALMADESYPDPHLLTIIERQVLDAIRKVDRAWHEPQRAVGECLEVVGRLLRDYQQLSNDFTRLKADFDGFKRMHDDYRRDVEVTLAEIETRMQK
jgi:hypothetical protein